MQQFAEQKCSASRVFPVYVVALEQAHKQAGWSATDGLAGPVVAGE